MVVAQTASVVVVTVAAAAASLLVVVAAAMEASLAADASDLPMVAVVLMRLPSLIAVVLPSPAPASKVVEFEHASASNVELELLPFVLSLDAAIAVESQRIGCCYLPILLGQGHFPMETFPRARTVPRCATRLGRKLVAVPRDKEAVLAVPRCPTRLQVWLLQVWLLLLLLLLLLQVWLQLVAAAGANLLVPILLQDVW